MKWHCERWVLHRHCHKALKSIVAIYAASMETVLEMIKAVLFAMRSVTIGVVQPESISNTQRKSSQILPSSPRSTRSPLVPPGGHSAP
jgi:hypothetical protein